MAAPMPRASLMPSTWRWTWSSTGLTTVSGKISRGSGWTSGAEGTRTKVIADSRPPDLRSPWPRPSPAVFSGKPMPIRTILAGVGGYLPERIVTNDELARTVDTSDEWIRERTGIRQRHFAGPHETAAFMATAAAREALAHANAEPADVDAVILATSTPDQAFPATAVRVMAALGIPGGFGFDLAAACAGFIYALSVADSMIR